MAKKWHTRVRDALFELACAKKKYEPHGGIIYIKKGESLVEYHPDVVWLYRGKHKYTPNAIIWEIESSWPPLKSIAGDSILSCLVRPEYARYYLRANYTKYGRKLTNDVNMPTYSGKQRSYWANYHSELCPNAKMLVVIIEHEEDWSINYYKRYLEVIGDFGGLEHVDVVSIPRSLITSEQVKNQFSRLKKLDYIL